MQTQTTKQWYQKMYQSEAAATQKKNKHNFFYFESNKK